MHAPENGLSQQAIDPVPAVPSAERRVELGLIPWETRSAADLDARESAPPEFSLWMRTPPVSPALAFALTANAADLTLIGTAVRPLEGVSQRDAHTVFTSAVISHTLWFHQPFRTDGWLLLRQHSPILAHGRCFGRGDVLTTDGSLVASYAQEALLCFPPGSGERGQPVEPWFVRSKKTGYGAGTSITAADPMPPSAHIAATPMPPPRRRSSCTSVTSIRAPVAATGCPSEQPLPFTLTRSGSRPSSRTVATHIAENA